MSRQRYPEEFKIEAVQQVTEKGKPVADVAERLGMSVRAELKRVTEERDIIKNRLPGAPRPIGLETLRSTLIPLDSGRGLFGG